MLILPPGHYAETRQPRTFGARERWFVAAGTMLIAALVAVTLFSLTSHRGKSGHGCLDFTYTMVMGGEEYHACGHEAAQTCASPPKLGGLGNGFIDALEPACKEAGLPFKTDS